MAVLSERCGSWASRNTSTKADTLARSISGGTGVRMKSIAPLAYALASSPSSPYEQVYTGTRDPDIARESV
jgi:hypothetical protein